MEPMYYIGLDVHKRKISYCVKDSSGKVFAEGLLSATRLDLWMKTLPQPWSAAMEATMFTGWINMKKLTKFREHVSQGPCRSRPQTVSLRRRFALREQFGSAYPVWKANACDEFKW
jgi:hypothetical protein